VRADPEKLRQVLVNLLSNAIKFTNARDGLPGSVEVTCAAGTDGRVAIRVRDTGIGIAAEKLGSIFEPVRAGALGPDAHGRGDGARAGHQPRSGARHGTATSRSRARSVRAARSR
jgi:signal transduction histidine kinase